MVKGKGPPLFAAFQHFLGQPLILFHNNGLVLFRQSGGVAGGADHRLHAQLVKAQIQHSVYVLQKVGVLVGKGAPHVVILPPPCPHQLLELRHDPVIAALPLVVHPVPVVDFPAAI